MKLLVSTLMAVLLFATAGTAQQAGSDARSLGTGERTVLGGFDAAGLESLRAAAGPRETGLGASEQGSLARVQAAHEDLAALRAGDLSDREVELILITVAVVVAIAIVL
jgi:hypothetical protein